MIEVILFLNVICVGKTIKTEERFQLGKKTYWRKAYKKLYDLCPHCYNLIVKSVINYRRKKDVEKN